MKKLSRIFNIYFSYGCLLSEQYLKINKNSIYNILDIIIFYSLILFIFALIYLGIAIVTIFYISNLEICPLVSNDITISYFNEISIGNETGVDNHSILQSNGNINENVKLNKISWYYHLITNKAKRRFYWEFIESEKNNFSSYKEFKNNWVPNTKIRAELKNEIKDEFKVPLNIYI